MQKTKLFTITLLAALLVCSALSFAAAQEEIPPATPNPDATVNPDETINPDDSRTLDDQTTSSDDNILYNIQGDNNTDSNTTDTTGQEPMPYGEEIYANGLADDKTIATDNTTLYITIAGAVAAVAVGGAVGIVYYRKTKN
jgi:hypothetical protein